ncbi:hypothetical protein EH183_35255 [Streptomyces sp. CB01881]|nr:hypothetical protein C2142_35185 [Streptomyces sp. CB01881]TYC69434.1 hypothetical protein EH183_35255 [Streptomyces sp. CB01881]
MPQRRPGAQSGAGPGAVAGDLGEVAAALHRAPAAPAGLGEGVTGLEAGQPVLAMDATAGSGFYAELAVVPAGRVTPLPDGVGLLAAATLPSAWLTAWYCLHRLARVAAGETVVVQAAASGVGSAAVQIAAEAGARVIAVAGSAEKAEWAAGFGAGATVDTSVHPEDAAVDEVLRLTGGRGAHVVLDTVGGRVFGQSLHQAGQAGRVVALANVALEPSTIDTRHFYPKNVSIHGFQITNLLDHGYDPRPDLREIAARVATGAFRVPVESVFTLEQAADARRQLERRGNRGKIVLTVAGDPACPRHATDQGEQWTDRRATPVTARRQTNSFCSTRK